MLNPYVKAVLAAIIAFLGGIAAGWDDSVLTTTEIVTAVGVGIAAMGAVWAAHKTIKWLVGGVLAGLSALAVAFQDDKLSLQEGITIVLAVLVSLYSIYATTATEASNAPPV